MEAAATAQRRHVRQLSALIEDQRVEAAATAQHREAYSNYTHEVQRVEAAATAQRRHVRQLTAIFEVQRVEAAATAQPRHVRQLQLQSLRFSVWRLLQLPSADTSVS